MGSVAHGAPRRAVRHGRPDSRPRRVVLYLPAALPAVPAQVGVHHRADGRRSAWRSRISPARVSWWTRTRPHRQRRRAAALEHTHRRAAAAARIQSVAGHSAVAHHALRHGARRFLRRRARPHPDAMDAGRRAVIGAGLALYQISNRVSGPCWPPRGCISASRSWAFSTHGSAALRGHPERAGPRDALHRQFHRAPRAPAFALDKVEERAMSGEAPLTLEDIAAQRGDARQRATVGRAAAARYVRADPGNPHLLRFRLRAQRPLHDRRQVPPDHAVGARDELRLRCRAHRGSTRGSPSRTATASRSAR